MGKKLQRNTETDKRNIQSKHDNNPQPYSGHPTASRLLYILLQIAHIINQLIEDGNLIRGFKAAYGTMKNLVNRMSESFRNDIIDTKFAMPGQIRLRTPT